MGRTKEPKLPPAEMPEILPSRAAAIEGAQDQLAVIGEVAAEAHALGALTGSIKMAEFLGTVATSAAVVQFEKIKKSKAWRNLANPKVGMHSNFATLEEYCEVAFGKSYWRMQQLATNVNALGKDAFEQAESLGLRQVDYNAIKALPAPDQELVRRAVEEAKSRDEVLDLLQELAARHATERKDHEEVKKELEAKDHLLAEKNKRIDQLKAEQRRITRLPADEQLRELKKEAASIGAEALAVIRGGVRQAVIAVRNHGDEDHTPFLAGLVGQLQASLIELRDEFNLPDMVGDGTPEWERWVAAQDARKQA